MMLYGKKSLFPQKIPRITEYTEVKINPGIKIKNIFKHLWSANKKFSLFLKIRVIRHTGIENTRLSMIPAVIILFTFFWSFSALYLVISLDTVMGIPELIRVNKKANTERATW